MKKFVEKNFIFFGITAVLVLIVVSASISFYNRSVIKTALDTKGKTEMVKKVSENTFGIIRKMDVSLRGYAIIREDKFLFYKPEIVRAENDIAFKKLDSLLISEGYDNMVQYEEVKKGVYSYIDHYEKMINFLKADNMEMFISEMRKDKGADVWKNYKAFTESLHLHEDKLNNEANQKYEMANFRNLLVQFLLIVIGFPTLFYIGMKLRRESAGRKLLLRNLENNNRKFLFNPGTPEIKDQKIILEKSIQNLQKASEFVTEMTQGNYDVKWDELNDQNKTLNSENLVGKLILMREQMKKVKQEDEKRLWTTEGLAQLSEIIRTNQNDLKELSNRCLLFLVKYIKAQQGSLFIYEEGEENDSRLRLNACYAFNRKKFINKEVEIGEGLIGQVFLEGASMLLYEIPQGYTSITSGLGDASPETLLIVPMKFNENVIAIAEFASFVKYQDHEVNFLEKAGEFIASAVAGVNNNEKAQIMLEEFRNQTEQMKMQEEELRQNMEELEATQEQMKRKEKELELQLSKASGSV